MIKRGEDIIIPEKIQKLKIGDNVIFITMSKDVLKAEELFKVREASNCLE
jgi:Trk K+ transport system NAD-binding subunit